jgi:hypothetical protein
VFAIDNLFGSIFYYELIVVVHSCSSLDKIRGARHPIAKLKQRNHYIGIG